MKLNVKRTILVGFVFFSITAFWQMYDSVIPLILKNTFALNEKYTGMIMATDNVLALFLLPLFGAISDRCTSKKGKRTPFILVGTILAVILMFILPLFDNSYAAHASDVKKIGFIIVLGLLLIAMGIYRSPAVSLMPDVTPKPLRSKANAIINLMGAIGGIIYLIITTILYSKARVGHLKHVNYFPLFLIVGALMLLSLAILYLTIDERKIEKELQSEGFMDKQETEDKTKSREKEKLPRPILKSLIFILLSIALWFIGYNAITTWFTTYAAKTWNMTLGEASLCLTIAMGAAIIAFVPIGIISSKFGRKRTILVGIVLLASCFASGFFLSLIYHEMNFILYIVFALVGISWASINVNSLPMVVEMCHDSDIGKFTGYYYTFSMSAQIITPILSGYLLHHIGYSILFPYGVLFVALSFFTMTQVKHGDSKEPPKKGLEQFEDLD